MFRLSIFDMSVLHHCLLLLLALSYPCSGFLTLLNIAVLCSVFMSNCDHVRQSIQFFILLAFLAASVRCVAVVLSSCVNSPTPPKRARSKHFLSTWTFFLWCSRVCDRTKLALHCVRPWTKKKLKSCHKSPFGGVLSSSWRPSVQLIVLWQGERPLCRSSSFSQELHRRPSKDSEI